MGYDFILSLANRLGYRTLTDLQEEAFRNPDAYDRTKNIMVVGPTSSGKTLVPFLLYAADVIEARRQNRPIPKMLFVVPYRALAAQKTRELRADLKTLADFEPFVAQSTGEIRAADQQIRNGEPDISVMITEKAFTFSMDGPDFLSSYQYVVLDEIGLIADQARGVRLDFLLSMAETVDPKPRLIALATPFYKWDTYAQQFGFTVVAAGGRPELVRCPVFFTGTGDSRTVDTSMWQCGGFPSFTMYREKKQERSNCEEANLQCPLDTPCRKDPSLLCPKIDAPCPHLAEIVPATVPYRYRLIAKICSWHLEQEHKILIFWNDREACRQLALYLYHTLKDQLAIPPAQEECERRILQACTDIANEESEIKRSEPISKDELFGILEPEHYKALCAGVGFHSSAVPIELRSYVENRFLEDSDLSIVCATETLAFGINSAVDAVIIADMNKNLEGGRQFLDVNTYFNYIGRCGRLRPGKRMEDIVGWVHIILNGYSPNDKRFDCGDTESEYMKWMGVLRDSEKPKPIYSTIFETDNSYFPFLLLCLIGDGDKTAADLARWIEHLPAPENVPPRDLGDALKYLLDHGLIEDASMKDGMNLPWMEPKYRVKEDRKSLCGYVPRADDFDIVLDALQKAAAAPSELFGATLLFFLTQAHCMDSSIRNFRMIKLREDGSPDTPGAQQKEDDALLPQAEERGFNEQFSANRLPETLARLPVGGRILPLIGPPYNVNYRNPNIRRRLVVTAAVLCWAESANPRQIYQWFHTSYPLIQGVTRELSYLLEIAMKCTYVIGRVENESLPHLEKRRYEIGQKIQTLEKSVYFGIQPELYHLMQEYLSGRPEASAKLILERISSFYPATTRQLRRVFTAYATILDGIRCQERGHGPENFHAVQSAIRELFGWVSSQGERTIWKDFAVFLRKNMQTLRTESEA